MTGPTVRVRVEAEFDVPTQGWGPKCTVEQVKSQAGREIDFWSFLVAKGSVSKPVPFRPRVTVVSVTLPLGGDL